MFDISAILHFCVSNKNILTYYDSYYAEERPHAMGSGELRGAGGEETLPSEQALQQSPDTTSGRAEAGFVNHTPSAHIPSPRSRIVGYKIETGYLAELDHDKI